MSRTLLPYQTRWVRDRSGLKVIVKSRRIGLSWAEAYDAVVHASADRGDVYYQSYAKDMTSGFISDCADWAAVLDLGARAVGETVLEIDEERIPAFRLPLANGRQILAMTSAPRAFRSKGRPGDRGIVDEAAFIDDLDEVLKAALAFRMWGGTVHVISTHNGETSPFNNLVEELREGSRPGSLHTVTFADAVGDGLYERIRDTTGDPEIAAAGRDAWVAGVRAQYGGAAAEELDCVPSAAGGAWLSWELLRSCEDPRAGDPAGYAGGQCHIGNDIGRRRDLWVAWVIETVGGTAWTREIVELRNASFSEQDDELDRLVGIYNPVRIAMDQTGMGEKPVEDAKRRYGELRVEGVLLTGPRRLALATALRERYEDRSWRAPPRKDVREDLHSIRKEPGATGGPRLVADDSHRESHADRFWAAALAAGAADEPRGPIEHHRVVETPRVAAAAERDWLGPRGRSLAGFV